MKLLETEESVKRIADEAESNLITSPENDWAEAYRRIAHGCSMLAMLIRGCRVRESQPIDPPFAPRPEDDPRKDV